MAGAALSWPAPMSRRPREVQRHGVAGRTILLCRHLCGATCSSSSSSACCCSACPCPAGASPQLSTGYVLVILYMMSPLTGIMNLIPVLTTAGVAVRKIREPGPLSSTRRPSRRQPRAPERPRSWQRLELAGVAHRHHVEGEGAFTLGPLDLALCPGELVFVVGGNGSGKTTLAKVLCGLYPPQGGEIRLDHERVTDESRERYRQHFSAVFSDFFVFSKALGGLDDAGLDAKALGYLRELRLERSVAVRDGKLSTVDLSQGPA